MPNETDKAMIFFLVIIYVDNPNNNTNRRVWPMYLPEGNIPKIYGGLSIKSGSCDAIKAVKGDKDRKDARNAVKPKWAKINIKVEFGWWIFKNVLILFQDN